MKNQGNLSLPTGKIKEKKRDTGNFQIHVHIYAHVHHDSHQQDLDKLLLYLRIYHMVLEVSAPEY